MDRQIPIYFDSVVVSSPLQKISDNNPNVGRLKVRVFTKYANRNGSYITDEVAEQLIKSATSKITPVVGFFDPETQTWASHTGPTLANAYGYVEDFLGWEPFTDTDGVTRDYAVFSVILFSDYYEEANKIVGQNQSMELNPQSITGDWATIEGQEYFVYTTAKMLGFCVIGSHEPCFSVSAFFAKNDNDYNTQYEKFSAILTDLKATVDGLINNDTQGGEQPMNEFENNQTVVEPETVEPTPDNVVEPETLENFEDNQPVEEEVKEEKVEEETLPEPSEFEVLQQQFNDLQNSYNELQSNYEAATARIEELEAFQANANTELETLRAKNAEFQAQEDARVAAEKLAQKNSLIEKYEKIIDEEEISRVREKVNDYSYDELESKLAIAFANKQMTAGSDNETSKKVPLPEPQESQFALLMKKYRKN